MCSNCFAFILLLIFLPVILRFILSLLTPLFGPIIGTKMSGFGLSREQALKNYLAVLMPLLAKIAKSDGRINEDEISVVERVMHRLNLTDAMRRYAQHIFIQAKDTPTGIEAYAAQFAHTVPNFETRLVTFQFMLEVACADNHLSPIERQLLLATAQIFNLPPTLIHQLFAQMAGGNTHTGRNTTTSTHHTRTTDLQLLGLGPNATPDDIKRAYRQKVKELHPDRLQAQGLPEAILKKATERMAEINAAYKRLTT